MPPEQKSISPGAALACAMSSWTELARSFGPASSTCGALPTNATPVKSFMGSNVVTFCSVGATATVVWLASKRVLPSGRARAT